MGGTKLPCCESPGHHLVAQAQAERGESWLWDGTAADQRQQKLPYTTELGGPTSVQITHHFLESRLTTSSPLVFILLSGGFWPQ